MLRSFAGAVGQLESNLPMTDGGSDGGKRHRLFSLPQNHVLLRDVPSPFYGERTIGMCCSDETISDYGRL